MASGKETCYRYWVQAGNKKKLPISVFEDIRMRLNLELLSLNVARKDREIPGAVISGLLT